MGITYRAANTIAKTALAASNLVKRYGNFTAVKNLSLEVYKGEIFGFLGPNGAGKTTSINMMCGLLKPDGGDVFINGRPLSSSYNKVKQSIGVCPQNIIMWEKLTCHEQLLFMAEMYDLDRKTASRRSIELLEAMGLSEKGNKLAKTLSGGMQRRLNIALALVHQPEILILDEPQAGLDPQSRVLVRDYILSLKGKLTVILTTHDMDEADRLSDRIAIIDKGELLVLDTPENLKNKVGQGDILEIAIPEKQLKKVQSLLSSISQSAPQHTIKGNTLSLVSQQALEILPGIIEKLKLSGVYAEDLKIRKRTLEDVFISLTGRGLRE